MTKPLVMAAITAALFNSNLALADSETEAMKQQLDALKSEYGQAIKALEDRLLKAEQSAQQANEQTQELAVKVEQSNASRPVSSGQNSFNPAISLVLDGRFASFDNNPEDYEIPGFALGNEAGLGEKAFRWAIVNSL